MRSRFLSNILLLVVAGALMTLSLVLAPGVVTWLSLAVGFAVLAITALAFLARDRGAAQRGLDAPIAVLAGWMMVASRIFDGTAVRWLSFGEAAAIVALTIAGLIVHEALSERSMRMLGDALHHPGFELDRRRTTTTLESGR